MATLEFRQILTPDHPDFPAVIALYEEAFPVQERISIAWMRRKLRSDTTQLWGGYVAQELAAIALLDTLPESKAMLLGYLATASHLRNQKLGSRLLEHVIGLAMAQSQLLILELEHPDRGDDRELRRRRVSFYQRFGAKLLKDMVYLLPALDGHTQTEMVLMVVDPMDRRCLPSMLVRQLVRELYTWVYQQDPGDPIFAWLETIAGDVELVGSE
jgi:GNAT superfamily N-acetyltransferase